MEKTILVGLVNRNQDHKKCQEYLDELEFPLIYSRRYSISEVHSKN